MAVVALTAPVATAQTAAAKDDGYPESTVLGGLNGADTGSGSDSGSDSGNAPAAVQSTDAGGNGGGSLPFTGMDVALLLGAGIVLAGTGFVVRRAVRPTAS